MNYHDDSMASTDAIIGGLVALSRTLNKNQSLVLQKAIDRLQRLEQEANHESRDTVPRDNK